MHHELGLYPIDRQGLSIAENLHLIRAAGFDYVCVHKMAHLLEEGPQSFRAAAEREGLPIDNIHLTGDNTNALWLEGALGDEVLDRYCHEIETAARLGVRIGIVHATWGFVTPPPSETGLRRYERMVRCAEKAGFVIAFENSAGVENLCAILDNIDSPAARFCYDSGHRNVFAPDTDILHRYRDRLVVTHLDDNDGRHDLHLIPFDGCADFDAIAPDLKRIPRLTFEVCGIGEKQTRCTAEGLRDSMRRIAIIDDARLTEIGCGRYRFYAALSQEEHLDRLMTAARKLRNKIENSP